MIVAIDATVASGAVLVPERRALFACMSVEHNLAPGVYPRRCTGDRDPRALLCEVFAIFPRLEERNLVASAATLSGGERQMLVLDHALMGRPHLLLLEEPSLDLAH